MSMKVISTHSLGHSFMSFYFKDHSNDPLTVNEVGIQHHCVFLASLSTKFDGSPSPPKSQQLMQAVWLHFPI